MKRALSFRFALTTAFAAGLLAQSPAFAAWQQPGTPTAQMAEMSNLPQPGVTATVENAFYKITTADVAAAVAEQLQTQGVVPKAEVLLNPGTPQLLYSSDHAVTVAIHSLQVDPQSKRWQAQAYFLAGGKTDSVKPVAGTFGAMIDVPVVTRQFARGDVIEDKDITMLALPERQLRKDTVTDPKALIGQSPKSGITPNRPIRTMEISAPLVIKRGDLVEMVFNTPYIHIKTTGVALEDGAKGATIRVKNQKSEHAVSAQVLASGKVQVAGGDTN